MHKDIMPTNISSKLKLDQQDGEIKSPLLNWFDKGFGTNGFYWDF